MNTPGEPAGSSGDPFGARVGRCLKGRSSVTEQIRMLVIAAHPDDCENQGSGLSKRIVDNGGVVKWISMTDGCMGHYEYAGAKLTRIRREESDKAAELIGVESIYLDFQDGSLMPTLEARIALIREIREYNPDIIVGHRVYDMHPDHRAAGQVVQDAIYMLVVPNVVPNVPPMMKLPLVLYFGDAITRPVPVRPDLVIDISDIGDLKARTMACHASCLLDWIPWTMGWQSEVPKDLEHDGPKFIEEKYRVMACDPDLYRAELEARYGKERAAAATWVERYEASDYGLPLTPELSARFFPF
jgi:LmbE family N-acetylglucosaminyl deacetylase